MNGADVKLNANKWYKTKRTLWSIGVIGVVFVTSLIAARWFQTVYVGWLVESVQSPNTLQTQWQSAVDEAVELSHPAVIHSLPSGCICTFLTVKHAKSVSEKALNAGFSVSQLDTSHQGLGAEIQLDVPELSPFIAITDEHGTIKYLGAYSDGVRCTTANSLVDRFVENISNLPNQPIVGLDVEVCRCE